MSTKIAGVMLAVAVVAVVPGAVRAGAARELPVATAAADGLSLKGTWRVPERWNGRAILLLHELCGNRGAWAPLLPGLDAAGIAVLAVDLRGFGETGGRHDAARAEDDARAWLAWMRTQPGVVADRVGLMGESLGARLALPVCAADERCRAAVALSPNGALGARDVAFQGRAVYLLGVSGDDVQSALTVRRLAADARGDVTIRLVAGNEPGVAGLFEEGVTRVPEVVGWVDAHL